MCVSVCAHVYCVHVYMLHIYMGGCEFVCVQPKCIYEYKLSPLLLKQVNV